MEELSAFPPTPTPLHPLQELEAAGEQRVGRGRGLRVPASLPSCLPVRANEAGPADRTCALLQGGCTRCATHPHADAYSAAALIVCAALPHCFHFTFTCRQMEVQEDEEGEEEEAAVCTLFVFHSINI